MKINRDDQELEIVRIPHEDMVAIVIRDFGPFPGAKTFFVTTEELKELMENVWKPK